MIIVGTGDESTNLHTALDLRRRYPEAHITVRSFARSPFAKDVATRARLQPFELGDGAEQRSPGLLGLRGEELERERRVVPRESVEDNRLSGYAGD